MVSIYSASFNTQALRPTSPPLGSNQTLEFISLNQPDLDRFSFPTAERSNYNQCPPNLLPTLTYQDLAPGQFLFQPGDPVLAFFVVQTGRLKLVSYTSEGKMVTSQIARAGHSFAEASLLSEVYAYAAVAEVASRVLVYPKSFLQSRPGLTQNLLQGLVEHVQFLQAHLELREISSAKERVLQYLRNCAQPSETGNVYLDRPFRIIAGELGLSPETFSRALSKLEKEGAILRAKRQISVCKAL
ncbi:Crp/Fnr family transcriptional regulator [Leptolyngbya sp. FACHB-261]|uniref:Crp/Fnr family transcriptional regulator n=1 Tax=Leptolyngbya sp. FACHB-261 TaxID=2692806 RepID=UPI0016858AF1|nr:Crp/Fnr family transcriptional regulator [Leptolyngbya sp. FACHB-261]MBD2103954.1 Crp/Fnr family transcriptional regulator [Leptolyngbya sp. FACHB-261]